MKNRAQQEDPSMSPALRGTAAGSERLRYTPLPRKKAHFREIPPKTVYSLEEHLLWRTGPMIKNPSPQAWKEHGFKPPTGFKTGWLTPASCLEQHAPGKYRWEVRESHAVYQGPFQNPSLLDYTTLSCNPEVVVSPLFIGTMHTDAFGVAALLLEANPYLKLPAIVDTLAGWQITGEKVTLAEVTEVLYEMRRIFGVYTLNPRCYMSKGAPISWKSIYNPLRVQAALLGGPLDALEEGKSNRLRVIASSWDKGEPQRGAGSPRGKTPYSLIEVTEGAKATGVWCEKRKSPFWGYEMLEETIFTRIPDPERYDMDSPRGKVAYRAALRRAQRKPVSEVIPLEPDDAYREYWAWLFGEAALKLDPREVPDCPAWALKVDLSRPPLWRSMQDMLKEE